MVFHRGMAPSLQNWRGMGNGEWRPPYFGLGNGKWGMANGEREMGFEYV